MLDERKSKVLQTIVDDYIGTAEPVGSRTIARKYSLGVSPATIRNEMADLEMMGYLEQPHTSAGRIPSAKGYRYYVDKLMSPAAISEKDVMLIDSWYKTKVRSMDEVFQETAKILSRVTRNVSLVLAPQISLATFKYLQFLPFDNQKTVVIIVTDTGLVESKVIDIPEGMSYKELQNIAQGINRRLEGLTFDAIKGSLLQEIKRNFLPDPELFEKAMNVLRQALATKKGERVYLGGTTQLLTQPEFQNVEKIKEILTMLEQEQLLCDILHMNENANLTITIGGENKYSGIKDCSVIQATYTINGRILGTVAVLGPTRMEYSKALSILQFMQNHLGDILIKFGV